MKLIHSLTLITQLLLLGGGYDARAAEPCADYSPERRAYFGDTHVHTSYSEDANWRMGSTRVTPDDAYRFARGDDIALPPFDSGGGSVRKLRLERPLDFAMVADHSEGMDIVRICESSEYASHGAWLCRKNQLLVAAAQIAGRFVPGIDVLCAIDTPECINASMAVWQDTIAAAQNHQSDCEFTAFIGYEWSGLKDGANLHRNVVFRSEQVPARPISALNEPHVEGLWQRLDEQCRDGIDGCESLTIPHNSNLSQGKMFSPLMGNGEPITAAVAEQRARYERLAEILQHKGASECYYGPGIGADELCAFERLPYGSFLEKYIPLLSEPPANDSRYLREALRVGLSLEAALGTNPFVPGFIGSTDTHIGAPGAVAENNYQGNHGAQHISGAGDVPQLPDRVEQNPGGLAVLYAEENTRDALFAAMRRREAYGTSGPRIQLRVFAGWELPEDLCSRPDLVQQGYAGGTPMGGLLQRADGPQTPRFVVAASRDPGTRASPGTPLQHIQLIKGWVAEDGSSREQIYELAGDPNNGASVDVNDCSLVGEGYDRLCAVWEDPAFDPGVNAFYYARVVENPSCRWQQHICARNSVRCDGEADVPAELAGCCDDNVPKTINERAWSSPIWYSRQSN